MCPALRWLGAGSTVAVFVIAHAVTGCDVTVDADVSATEADSIVALLHAHHVGAFKRQHTHASAKPTFDVAVVPSEAAQAIAVLRSAGTLDPPNEPVAHVVSRTKPIPTVAEEQEQIAGASARDLERVIALWDGVISARVRITPAATARPLGSSTSPTRASVVIKHQADRAPALITIRDLVSHSIPGLRTEDLFVVLLEARRPVRSPLVQLGPIAVTRGSAEILRFGMVATLSLLGLCAVLLAWTRTGVKRRTADVSSQHPDRR